MQVFFGMTDGVTIFDDIFTGRCILDEDLMSCRRILSDYNVFSIHLDYLILLERTKTNYDRVGWIDFNKRLLLHND